MAEQPKSINNVNDHVLDTKTRKAWKLGSQVEIYSDSKQKWLKGKITNIMNDEEGEWLTVKYDAFNLKEIQRFNKFIRQIKIQKRETLNDELDNENNENDIDYANNIAKYRNELKFTWQRLLETKDESGLAIYNTIIFDTKIKDNMTTIFMNMLNTIISNLDESQTLIEKLIEQLKVDHEHYMQFKHGFMKGIKKQLINIWNISYDNAWEWFWDFMISSQTLQQYKQHPLIQRVDTVMHLVEDELEQFTTAVVPKSICDKIDILCCALHESLMDEKVSEKAVTVPKFKFVCACGSKFKGDIVSKFTQKNMVCSECNVECESFDWIWNCSNTNFQHFDAYCLCINCGDKWLQNEMELAENVTETNNICDCGGVFISSKTNKCFGCDRFLDSTILHCNLCGNTYGYSISMEAMDILCSDCARNQMTLNDISHEPFEQKFTLSTDTVEEFGIYNINAFQTDSSRNLQVGYDWSNNYKSDTVNNSGNVGFVTNDNEENELHIMTKLSYLQARISELFKVKLQTTSLFELKGHKDFKLQTKKEQATIMEIIDMLKDMKNMSPQYYQQYSRQNKWAIYLLDTFDNILLNDKPYDAFNE